MAAVKELIRAEADGRISFGDYTLEAKTKKSDFEFEGNLYKVKTFKELTRLERNEMFVYESEPGSAVLEFDETEDTFAFSVEAPEDIQITVQADPETEYDIYINGELKDTQKSNLGGKLSFSVDPGNDAARVEISRK
jgi:hypothetical protein